jgi:nucleotide-binding universal stress UspA family protein
MPQTVTTETVHPILVPTDFSAMSTKALLFAAQLAQCSSLSLVVLHVVHEDVRGPVIYPRENEREQILPIDEIAERMLRKFMVEVREQYPDIEVLANAARMVVSGLPATRIPEIACLIDASLIVVGSNGRSPLSKLIAGSVSEKVIRKSHVPVTIVQQNGTVCENGKIGVRQIDGAEPFQVSADPA